MRSSWNFVLEIFRFKREVIIPILYRGQKVGETRLDFVVGDTLKVIVEAKAIEKLADIHTSQCISYLKASNLKLAILANFNVRKLVNFLKEISNFLSSSVFSVSSVAPSLRIVFNEGSNHCERSSLFTLLFAAPTFAQEAPATQPVGHFPFLQVDARKKIIEIECEAIDCKNPLEFFLCSTGTNEHEAVLRSKVRPSHLHAALLMLGLQPGEPVHFSEAQKAWLPPHGPPLELSVRFQRDNKTIELPAHRLMRDLRTKKEIPPLTWIFAGSRVMDNGIYAADQTGYLVSVVNFDLTVIDIPKLASSANETLEWEINTDLAPPGGTPVTLVITPAGGNAPNETPAAQPAANVAPAATGAPIAQPLITIDETGHIKLDDAPIVSLETLLKRLQQRNMPDHRVRLAVANSIEENPTARDVMNLLSRSDIRFVTIPQAQAHATTQPGTQSSDAGASDALVRQLQESWEQKVAPHDATLRDAAKAHAEVIAQLRAEQQKLIDSADKIQRLIDQLDKRYEEMGTGPQLDARRGTRHIAPCRRRASRKLPQVRAKKILPPGAPPENDTRNPHAVAMSKLRTDRDSSGSDNSTGNSREVPGLSARKAKCLLMCFRHIWNAAMRFRLRSAIWSKLLMPPMRRRMSATRNAFTSKHNVHYEQAWNRNTPF